MKNSIKRYAGFILCAFIMLLWSCSQNPVDKKLDEMEGLYVKMSKIAHDQNPSDEEIISLKNDMLLFGTSSNRMLADNSEFQQSKMTRVQKKRALDIMVKWQSLDNDPGFRRIMKRIRTINSNR
jgi:hypothetical protein